MLCPHTRGHIFGYTHLEVTETMGVSPFERDEFDEVIVTQF